MRRPAALALAVLLALTACGGDEEAGPHDDAVASLRGLVENLDRGQTGPMYEALHPAQQDLIDRDTFMECYGEQIQAFSGDIRLGDVIETYEEKMTVPGTDTEVDSVAITVEVSVGGETDTTTFHQVEADGEWTWTWSSIDECLT